MHSIDLLAYLEALPFNKESTNTFLALLFFYLCFDKEELDAFAWYESGLAKVLFPRTDLSGMNIDILLTILSQTWAKKVTYGLWVDYLQKFLDTNRPRKSVYGIRLSDIELFQALIALDRESGLPLFLDWPEVFEISQSTEDPLFPFERI